MGLWFNTMIAFTAYFIVWLTLPNTKRPHKNCLFSFKLNKRFKEFSFENANKFH